MTLKKMFPFASAFCEYALTKISSGKFTLRENEPNAMSLSGHFVVMFGWSDCRNSEVSSSLVFASVFAQCDCSFRVGFCSVSEAYTVCIVNKTQECHSKLKGPIKSAILKDNTSYQLTSISPLLLS